jgi:hypothetical protein
VPLKLFRPFHGLRRFCLITPRVSLRSTLGFMLPPASAGSLNGQSTSVPSHPIGKAPDLDGRTNPLFHNTVSFFNGQYPICHDVFERFSLATRPTDLDDLGLFRLPQPEVEALIVVRVVTGLAGNLLNLQPRAGPQQHSRSYGAAV